MAQLKGNDLSEWIKALEPVAPEQFETMEQGTKIIHLSSNTMEPEIFFQYDWQMAAVHLISDDESLDFHSETGWYFYPEPAVEVEPIKAAQKGKVRELGDGTWKTLGVKESRW